MGQLEQFTALSGLKKELKDKESSLQKIQEEYGLCRKQEELWKKKTKREKQAGSACGSRSKAGAVSLRNRANDGQKTELVSCGKRYFQLLEAGKQEREAIRLDEEALKEQEAALAKGQ